MSEKIAKLDNWNKDPDFKSLLEKECDAQQKHLTQSFKKWGIALTFDTVLQQEKAKLRAMRREIGSLSINRNSREVEAAKEKLIEHACRERGDYYKISIISEFNDIDKEKEIAEILSTQKREAIIKALIQSLPIRITETDSALLAFLDREQVGALAQRLTPHYIQSERNSIQHQLNASKQEIDYALAGDEKTIKTIADRFAKKQFLDFLNKQKRELSEQRNTLRRLEKEFVTMKLGTNEAEVDLLGLCLWVPANLRHTPGPDGGSTRFVYGGVSILPTVTQTQPVLFNSNSCSITPQQLQPQAPASGGGASGGGGSAGGGSGGDGGDGGGPGKFDRKAIRAGCQDHHIISWSNPLTKNHPLLEKAGFDLESRANKIFLPTTPDLHPTRSIHWGKHTKISMEKIATNMKKIEQLGDANGWSQEQYHSALRKMLAQERAELKAGNVALNRLMRPWAR